MSIKNELFDRKLNAEEVEVIVNKSPEELEDIMDQMMNEGLTMSHDNMESGLINLDQIMKGVEEKMMGM